MAIRSWKLFAELYDGSEICLNPDQPFVGDMFDAGEEADRLTWEIGEVEGLILEAGPIVVSMNRKIDDMKEVS